ncbi:hypothetical protein ABT072_48065, partial [Streptomyces sp. NPDC002589]
DFGAEYKRNVVTAGKFVAKTGTKAQVNLGLAQIQPNPRAATPPGPRAGAIASQTPGIPPAAGTKTPSSVNPSSPGPTAVPMMPTPPTPAPPPAPPRRRATRPPGPPKPRP